MNNYQNILRAEFPSLIQMFESTIDFKRWGFRRTFVGVVVQLPPSVIYDSEWCKVRFMWQASDRRDGDGPKITILYGRLHAPVDQLTIT